jgi:hypothetical protein
VPCHHSLTSDEEALADAELALIVGSSGAAGLADVVLLWQLTIADLDKVYLDDMAEESLAAVLAELEIDRAYAAGLASADEALLNADDLARVDRWLDEVNADSALRTAQAGALRDFQSELYEAW